MRKILTRVALLLGATAGIAGATAAVAHQVTAATQKALVYCPVGVDVAGCNTIVATLGASGAFAGGVDRAYDGTSGTVDLATVDLAQYAVLVVPSLAADATHEPYAVLRSAAVQQRLAAGLTGRIAVWAGTPDLGTASRAEKDQLLRNLAAWSARDWALAGSTGLVALADLSADAARRYDWIAGVSRLRIGTDAELYGFDAATPLTGTAKEILKKPDGTTPTAYANMASFGISVPDGAVGTRDAEASTTTDAGTVTRTVLITAPGGTNTGGARITTDKNDYPPGETVTFTGGGWTAGETVTLTVHENPTEHDDRVLTAVADSAGGIRNAELLMEPHDLDVTFYVTAKGGTSGFVAQTSFTDGNPQTLTLTSPGSVSVAPGGTATYTLTVQMGGTATACTVMFSVTPALPTGATASFNGNPANVTNQDFSRTLTINTTTATPAGSYPFTVTAVRGSSCQGNGDLTTTGTLVVTSSSSNTSVSAASATYSATAAQPVTLSATVSSSSPVNAGTVTFTVKSGSNTVGSPVTSGPVTNGSASASYSLPAGTPAGTYTIAAEYNGSGGFLASSGNGSLTVGQASQSITFAAPTGLTFGGADLDLGAASSSGLPVAYASTTTGVCTIVNGKLHAAAAGSCAVTASQGGNANYLPATPVTQTFTIGKGTATIALGALQQTYTGSPLAATVTTTPSGLAVTLSYKQGGTDVAAPTNAGSYDVTATITDASYAGAVTGTLVVARATQAITFAALPDKAFGDAPFGVSATASSQLAVAFTASGSCTVAGATVTITGAGGCTVTASQGGNGNFDAAAPVPQTFQIAKATATVTWPAPAAITYGTPLGAAQLDASASVAGTFAYSPAAGTVLGAGSQTLSATFTPANAANYNGASASVTLIVNKAPQAITFAPPGDRTYGDQPFAVGATGGPSGNPVTLSATGACTVAGETVTIVSAGSCSITAAQGGNDNYLAAGSVTRTFTVARAALTIVTDSKTRGYGAPNPELTGSVAGQVNGDAFTATFSTTATAESPVGSYPIIATIADPGVRLANYDVTNAGGTLTITRAPLTVRADAASRVYGTANPAFTASYDGFVLGQGPTVLGGTLAFSGPAMTADPRTNVGSYAITPGGLTSGNYAITFVDGSMTITKAALTVAATNATRVYGDPNPTLDVTLTGVVAGDGITAGSTTAATQASDVGSYPIVPSLHDPDGRLGNYEVTSTDGALTVTKAPLGITAAAATKVYGDANPTLTGTITGIRNGDGITATYATAATASSGVGGYDIVPAAVDATPSKLGNYAVTLTKAALTVTPRALTVRADDKSKVYGAALPALTASFDGFVLNQDAAVLGGTLAFDTQASASSHVGSYTITPKGLTSTNYAIAFTDGTLQVTKAPLTITADDKSRVYGGENPAFTASYSGFVLGETPGVLGGPLSFSGPATTAGVNTDVGEYVATPGGATSNDYAITFVDGKLTITKAPLSVAANSKSRVYGDANPELDGAVTGAVGTDVITVTYSTPATPASPVGDYPIVPALVDGAGRLGNYDVTSTNGTLTVTRAPLTITADDKSRVYGSANPALTGTIVGIRNGDGITAAYATSATPSSNVGSYDIVPTAVDATPAKLGNYAVTLQNGKLTITPATPTVVWATPAPVPQGTVLSATQLNATASGVNGAAVQGTFAYVPPAGIPVYDVGTKTLTAVFTSQDGNYTNAAGAAQLGVTNVAPVVTVIALGDGPIPVSTAASITAQFTDPGVNDVHTATIAWDDGQSSTGTVSNRTVTASHTYTSAGVYTVTVTVADNKGGSGSRASSQDVIGYVVVYDPSAGFVTGGGWISSPAGACRLASCTDGTTGKASFGFNAKYQRGANVPDGNTEFQFQAGGLNFKSTTYSWLVVAGTRAQYKGTGTINGRNGYSFLLTAIDGDSKASPDAFRMKIVDGGGQVVYDNQMGQLDDSNSATALGGGSVVIHQ